MARNKRFTITVSAEQATINPKSATKSGLAQAIKEATGKSVSVGDGFAVLNFRSNNSIFVSIPNRVMKSISAGLETTFTLSVPQAA